MGSRHVIRLFFIRPIPYFRPRFFICPLWRLLPRSPFLCPFPPDVSHILLKELPLIGLGHQTISKLPSYIRRPDPLFFPLSPMVPAVHPLPGKLPLLLFHFSPFLPPLSCTQLAHVVKTFFRTLLFTSNRPFFLSSLSLLWKIAPFFRCRADLGLAYSLFQSLQPFL